MDTTLKSSSLTGKAKSIAEKANAKLNRHINSYGSQFSQIEFKRLLLTPIVEVGAQQFLQIMKEEGVL